MSTAMRRAGSKNNQPVVAQAQASSTTLDIEAFGQGAVNFSADPGVVTVYTRCGPGDTWGIAQKDGGGDITFSPGTTPYPLPPDCFNYNEIRLEAANAIAATACYASFKS